MGDIRFQGANSLGTVPTIVDAFGSPLTLTLEAKLKYQEDGNGPFRRMVWWGGEAPLAGKGFCLGISVEGHLQFQSVAETAPTLGGFVPLIIGTRQVVAVGNYAYMAGDRVGLTIVDISNPAAPLLVGCSDVLFDGIYMAVSGSYAYITGQRTYYSAPGTIATKFGFYILDISTPAEPKVVGSIEGNSIGFNGVAVSGNYAYVAIGLAGMSVIDITTKTNPFTVGTGYNTPGFAVNVTVSGNYAYIADSTQGLRIANITNPLAPVAAFAGGIDTVGNAKSVTIVGTLAYVADNTALRIFDVSNPAVAPVPVGSYAPGGFSALSVKVVGTVAYVAASGSGLITLDVSNPASPAPLNTLPPASGSGVFGVSVVGTVAYTANLEGGLGVINVANPASLTLIIQKDDWFEGIYMATKPGLAVVAGRHLSDGGNLGINGLRIVNTQNPSAPYIVGDLDTSSLSFSGVAIAGDYAYLACGPAGVKVLDISNPADPTIVGEYATTAPAGSVTISGIHAYVADGEVLRILDISNPLTPAPLGWVNTPAIAVAVVGGFAYVAAGTAVRIVDVTNPNAPFIKGTYAPNGFIALDVKVQGTVAYVASSSAGLVTLDVSNPDDPRQLGSLPASGGRTFGLSVSGTVAYLANLEGNVAIVDVSNPALPVLRNSVKTPGSLRDIILDGAWLYLSDTFGTLTTIALSAASNVRSEMVLQPQTWYRAAVTYNGTTALLYVNGVPVTTVPVLTPFQWTAPQLRFGQWSGSQASAVRFDGVNDYINVPNSASLNITGTTLTLEAVVKFKATKSGVVVSKGTLGGTKAWTLAKFDGKLSLNVFTTSGVYSIIGSSILATDQFYHVAAVLGSGALHLYLNGSEESVLYYFSPPEGVPGGPPPSIDPIPVEGTIVSTTDLVSFGNFGGDPISNHLTGDIAEVRIWSTARTEDNLIAGLAGVSPQSGLVGLWRLDEASGVTANDVSGNANHGTLTNGPIWTEAIGGLSLDELRVWTTVRTPAQLSVSAPQNCPYNQVIELGQAACGFTVNQIFWNGQNVDTTLDYTPFRGKVLLLFFNDLGTCAVARTMTDQDLTPLYNQYAGLDILNVSGVASDTIQSIRQFADSTSALYRFAFLDQVPNQANQMYWHYRVNTLGYPLTVIIDRNAVVRYWHKGFRSKANLEEIVVPLLAESYNGAITPPVAGLLALYNFDETTGATAADSSTNNHPAALSGTWQWEGVAFSGSAAYAGKVEVNLWWEPIADAESYNVKRSEVTGGPYTLVGNTLWHYYRDVNVVAGTMYYYKVYPVVVGVEGEGSAELSTTPTVGPAETAAPKSVMVLGR